MMNALCGINPATAGKVWIDNVPLEGRGSVKKLSIGFVPQEDIVHSELTVDQAITFSAKLRLRLPGAVIKTLVDGVIGRLGLEEHRLKRISQLSGGKRKRVSIATELLKPGFSSSTSRPPGLIRPPRRI
ncbi:MAG: ATP-binding cassette domain-containing protein [Verrucomicrobiales bacterium]